MSVAGLLAAALMLAQPAAGDVSATIRGRVLDADGRPMAGVEMQALLITSEKHVNGALALSDAEGTFEIQRVLPGRIILRAQPRATHATAEAERRAVASHPPAYFPGVLTLLEAWPIEVEPREIIELDFHMPPVFIGSIKTVVSGPDGYTLDQLRVMRPEANQITNVTLSPDGIGYADRVREGRYIVAARGRSKHERLAAFQIVHITGGEVEVALALEPAAKVTGRIIVERGGVAPVANALVVATWTDGTINLDPLARDEAYIAPDGSFTIDGLFGTRTFHIVGLPDGWQVSAVRQDRNDVTSSGIELRPGATVAISIVLAQARSPAFPEQPPLLTGTASIHGRVIDQLSGKPIEAAEVRLVDTTIETETKEIRGRTVTSRQFTRSARALSGSDGSYAFDGIREGTYRLFVMHRMYLPSCVGPAFVRGQCDVITVAPDQRVDAANQALSPGGIIRGRVLDKDGRPLAGATVRSEFSNPVLQSANSATSGDDGRFEITSVPPGQALVRVDPPGGRPVWHRVMYYPGVHERDAAQLVTTESGKEVEIEIRLREIPTATLRTTLKGPEGFRVQKMTVANPDTRTLFRMNVSDEGAASVADLDEGRYVIAATAAVGSDTLAAYQLIIVGTGEYDVPMYLEPTATITGRVVIDRGGVPPLDGVTVEAHWVAGGGTKLDLTGPERVSPSPDGAFAMSGLFGRRQIELFGMSDEWRVVAVRAGRSDVTPGIDLAPGSTTEITIVVARK